MREVTKQLTGIFLFCVMTIVGALETPALKYCLCDNSFVMSDCACEVDPVEITEKPTCSSMLLRHETVSRLPNPCAKPMVIKQDCMY